jgi:hypothetical protein
MTVYSISGCADNRCLITHASISNRDDKFVETASLSTESVKAITDIEFSVKSNSSYFAETYIMHSNPPYHVHLNIDGQIKVLEAEPVLEDTASITADTPESGTGWKYHFTERIALSPGKHKLMITLPADNVIVEREIVVRAGVNTIKIMPVYKKKWLRPFKGQNFAAGVKTLEVTIN